MTFGTLRQKWRLRSSGLLMISVAVLSTLLPAGFASDEDRSMRDKLIGTWQQSDGSRAARSIWTLQDSGDSMDISNSDGTRTVGRVRVQHGWQGM